MAEQSGMTGAGLEAVFADGAGELVQQPWGHAADQVRLEELGPVSPFPALPGKRWGPGWWWSATTGRHVAHGSAAMRDQLMLLDRDPAVVGLASRPVQLVWRDEQEQVRSWVPQLFARYADGSALLADCPVSAGAGGVRARQAEAVLMDACAQVGWSYRRLETPYRKVAANVRWLAGYRHPRHRGGEGVQAAVRDAFVRPRPLMEGVRAVGDPLAVLPCVFHALWAGRLSVPLSAPLHERSRVRLAVGRGQR